MRIGQSTRNASHLIKVAVEAAIGQRAKIDVFGTDYPTADGTCVRDYIHVSDLVQAHLDALRHLRAGGASSTFNCGYGRGYSVLDVIETVKRVSGFDFRVDVRERRAGDPAQIIAASDRARYARLATQIRRSGHHRRPYPGVGTKARSAKSSSLRQAPISGCIRFARNCVPPATSIALALW
jgi:UDP-glucose 4-epimerase